MSPLHPGLFRATNRDMLKLNMKYACIIFIAIMVMGCARKPEYPKAPVTDDNVIIEIKTLNDMQPVFYTLQSEGRRYDFFVQSINGEIAAYLDACYKCAPKQKGFRVEGRKLHCNACGESFRLDSLDGVGSCYPLTLKGEIIGGNYLIKVSEIIRKTRYPL